VSQQYFIGIDGGTQSSKVCIFDMHGHEVSEGKQTLRPLDMHQPGMAEHPEDDLWESLKLASQQAMQSFSGEKGDIKAIGLCTIRCCRADLKADGSLAAPVLNWMDLRLAQKYHSSSPEVAYVTSSSGYITHRLTGEFKDSAANYEGQWPIDKRRWAWSLHPDEIERCGLTSKQLFDLVKPGEVLGHLSESAALATGFPIGLPVVATANDKAVEALGAGLGGSDTALISLGTYIGAMVPGTDKLANGKSFFTNMACVPHHYLYETGGVRYGMSTISWLKELFGSGLIEEAQAQTVSAEDLLNREASAIAVGSDGLITIPEWLAPTDQLFKKGIMLGFQASHRRAHLYRSALEGIAMTMKNHLDACVGELGLDLKHLVISGGGSNSNLFMQILADVFGLPTMRNHVTGSASLGSAMCAAVAVNAYASFAEAQQAMVRRNDTFMPNTDNTQIYQQINQQVFSQVTSQTDLLLENLHSITQ